MPYGEGSVWCGDKPGVSAFASNFVRGMANVLCSHSAPHAADGGWEARFDFDPQSSPVSGPHIHFLPLLSEDLQDRFAEGEWVDTED